MKNLITKIALLKFIIIGIFFIPFISYSESEITVQPGEISIEIIPENPNPYEDVTIRLVSYATDIDKANISWKGSNGFNKSGLGEKEYSFRAPGANESISFDITIIPSGENSSIKKKIVISPHDLNLMWESIDGYVPPFYKGKCLPTRGSVVKVVAIPNSNTVASGIGNFDYTWKNSDQTVENSSGYNKNAYVFKNSLFSPTTPIEVQVSSVSGGYNTKKTLIIPTYNPIMVFYKKSPSDGILFNNAIVNEYQATENITTFVSSPYYLATNNGDFFEYNWSANEDSLPTPSKKEEITISLDSNNGYADIKLAINSLSALYQRITSSFRIKL